MRTRTDNLTSSVTHVEVELMPAESLAIGKALEQVYGAHQLECECRRVGLVLLSQRKRGRVLQTVKLRELPVTMTALVVGIRRCAKPGTQRGGLALDLADGLAGARVQAVLDGDCQGMWVTWEDGVRQNAEDLTA
ncbi:MAG: hypothetical protein HN849_08000 [Victivallales bacterium]|nr:hypothetical protein [Victivallales bacterium]MBT7163465.1 hypothetical protein [Victivallales bacterium]MBT7299438.1 hypothetical protein [Victivallales bacterium]